MSAGIVSSSMRSHTAFMTTDRVFTAAPERAEQIMRVVYARIPARNWPGSTARRTASRAVSSRRLRQEFPDLARPYWRANRLWPGSYFAGPAGGAPHLGPAPVHRIAAPPRLTGSRPPAFTTGLKAGALADNPVAAHPRVSHKRHGQNYYPNSDNIRVIGYPVCCVFFGRSCCV